MCSILNIEMHLFHRETGTDTQISEYHRKESCTWTTSLTTSTGRSSKCCKKRPHPGKGDRKGSFPLFPRRLRQNRASWKNRADHRLSRPGQPGLSWLSYKSLHQSWSRALPEKDFYPFIQAIPNVIECNCVTGDYSMLIEVAFRSTMELDHFINELQQFGRTKTLIVFSTSVEHRDLPVE